LVLLGFVSVVWGQKLELVPARAGRIERAVKLPGELVPYQTALLQARVNGYVEKMLVDRGSRVQTGDPVAILTAPELTAALGEAELKIRQTEARRTEADAEASEARRYLTRLQKANETAGAVAPSEIDAAQGRLEAAEASFAAAAKAVEAASAALAILKKNEEFLTVRAPFSGVITERLAHPGTLAGPAAGLAGSIARLEEVARLRLAVPVPEAELGRVPRGSRVAFTVPAFPGETFTGTVARTAASLDVKTRTMIHELDVANGRGRLAPGMYPEVEWRAAKQGQAFLLPATAVFTTTEKTFVIRNNNGRAEHVRVRKGPREGEVQEVYGPLKEGDPIVKRASDEIRPGTPIDLPAAIR
jgi:RND family efflux transporter MFP subunit